MPRAYLHAMKMLHHGDRMLIVPTSVPSAAQHQAAKSTSAHHGTHGSVCRKPPSGGRQPSKFDPRPEIGRVSSLRRFRNWPMDVLDANIPVHRSLPVILRSCSCQLMSGRDSRGLLTLFRSHREIPSSNVFTSPLTCFARKHTKASY